MPDLNALLAFVRVVQAGSFTAGARALGLPKSTVSRKIAALEARLGARLLQRTTRKLGLTDAGRLYFDRAARVVGEVEEAERAIGATQAAPHGRLRVTAPISFEIVGPIIAEYLRRYPAVEVEMSCTDRRVDLVEEGYDLAVRVGPLGDSSLIARSLGHVNHHLVASPAYLARRGTPRAPAELARHDLVLFAPGAAPTSWTLRRGAEAVRVPVRSRLVVNDFDVLSEAARAGLGIASLPALACSGDVRRRRLRRVLPAWLSARTPLHALYPSTRQLSPKVKAFVDLLAERLRLPP